MSNRTRHLNSKVRCLGAEFETNRSGKCKVIEYINFHNIIVEFENPKFVVKTSLQCLKTGKVFNPLTPILFNKGVVGVGNYSSANEREYYLWTSMLERSCCSKFKSKHSTYADVAVCEDWLDFQNFAAWCNTQKLFNAKDDKGKSYHLDKDILVKGCKVYSPETCRFIPQRLNKLLSTRNKLRGEYPLGVCYNKRAKLFVAAINVDAKAKHLGYFKDEQSAFQAYKTAKEAYIKEVAEDYFNLIDEDVYEALLRYVVIDN